MRRLIVPISLLASSVVCFLAFGALLLTDQWQQSGAPVVEGETGVARELDAEGDPLRRMRMGRRGGFKKGPSVRVSQAVARGAQCGAHDSSGRTVQLRRTSYDEEGGITPLIDTWEPAEGRVTLLRDWDASERFRGELPVFVAHERTFLRRLGYGALIAGLLPLAIGGWRLSRALQVAA